MSVAWQATLFGSDAPAVDADFTGMRRVHLDDTAWVDRLPGWLRGHDVVMDDLVRTAPWRSSSRPMYDRIVDVPRLTAWYSWEDGTYPEAASPILEEMRAALSQRYGVVFTSCGCNLYRDGNDSVAWHGDRIRREVEDPRVAIVSVGEPRKLLMRPVGGGQSRRFDLGHGDLFVMGGSSQRTWQHAVPKVAAAAPRMSITFRHGMLPLPAGYGLDMAERDPRQEPENSTVDDWHGQKVDRMIEDAERVAAESDDQATAERRFEEETKEP